jgi:hypothetical protein
MVARMIAGMEYVNAENIAVYEYKKQGIENCI